MRTVSGSVVSWKPIRLSKAAKILSKFTSSENGASPAFAAYLKRASSSFDELVELHKESNKKYLSRDENTGEAGYNRIEERENGTHNRKTMKIDIERAGASSFATEIQEDGRKRHKKKIVEDGNGAIETSIGFIERNGVESDVVREGGAMKKHKKKKSSYDEIDEVANGETRYEHTGLKADNEKTRKKKNKGNRVDNGQDMGIRGIDEIVKSSASGGRAWEHIKKQIYEEGEERERGKKVENHGKGSRKRKKNEEMLVEDLGDSYAQKQSEKKKKRKTGGHD